jgi:spore coat protein A
LGLALSGAAGAIAAAPRKTLAPFVDALPLPGAGWPVIDLTQGMTSARLAIGRFQVQFHRDLPPTTVWGYGPTAGRTTHLSPTILARRGTPVEITFDLAGAPTAPLFAPDTSIHPSDHPGVPGVRFNTHLHGGFVRDVDDGNPYAHAVPGLADDTGRPFEITPNGAGGSPTAQTMAYPNAQDAAMLFYHDHALGITRSNVYAAAAGGYVIIDNDIGAPNGPAGIPLVIQDKLFDDGNLSYPSGPGSWVPEFFGNVSLVNGKIWPFMNVRAQWYRFRVLNASNSRIYNLRLFASDTEDPLPFMQIGTDLGSLAAPVAVRDLVLAPAERADVLVNFSAVGGQRVDMRATPLPPNVVSPATPLLRRDVMRFNVASGRPVRPPTLSLPSQPTGQRRHPRDRAHARGGSQPGDWHADPRGARRQAVRRPALA